MKWLLTFSLLLLSQHAMADSANPFKNGDAKAGKTLVNQHCIQCHAARFGGDGSAIYTRTTRIVTSSAKLSSQIRNCNTMLDLKWFEDEELNVAKYLNEIYYKFTQ